MSLASDINLLGEFCGRRDVGELTREALKAFIGAPRADVMVLFGGSILCGGDVLAAAMREGVAGRYIIVGGAGHTTPALRGRVGALFPDLDTRSMAESELFSACLERKYGLAPDYIETQSTNCGNNITNLLRLLKDKGISCESVILTQDATMQLRMDATLRRHRPDMTIVNFAAYRAKVVGPDDDLRFEDPPAGMWDLERYATLLCGEIARLRDDAEGYGPNGRGYIAHVEIPEPVDEAWRRLKGRFAVRAANPEFAQAQCFQGGKK